jgi:hypothetical protein
MYPRTNDDEELLVKRLKDDDFRKLLQSVNIEQTEFLWLACACASNHYVDNHKKV